MAIKFSELNRVIHSEPTLARDILRDRRQYFINKVKAPFVKALILIGERYPEPTHENVRKRNSHVLLDICAEFAKYNSMKPRMFNAIKRIVISEYEHDGAESQRMDWLLERLLEKYNNGEWKKLEPWNPSPNWTEPAVLAAQVKLHKELEEDFNKRI